MLGRDNWGHGSYRNVDQQSTHVEVDGNMNCESGGQVIAEFAGKMVAA